MCSGLPPSLMSTPRPAMLVAIITAPTRPAWAMTSPSRSACSGFAFSTACSMPWRFSSSESISETSTEIVPTSAGCPRSCRSATSFTTAFHLLTFVL